MRRFTRGASLCWLQTGAFLEKDKSDQGTREHTSPLTSNLTLRKSSWVCVPVENTTCAQCLLYPKRVQLRALKIPFNHLELAKGLEPLTLYYKSDALPAELRQHKPPVTGHKVNKLAQRQSACNISTPGLCKGKRNLRGTAPLCIVTILSPLRPPSHTKKPLNLY